MRAARIALLLGLALVAAGCAAAHAFSPMPAAPATPPPVTIAPSASPYAGVLAGQDEAIDGPGVPEAVPLAIGPEVEFPPDTVLFIESGCWGCDGPPAALFRASRVGEGPLAVDKVFEVDRDVYSNGYVIRYEVDQEGSELRAFVCTRGYCGALGYPQPDSEVTLFRSWDLGTNWQQDAVFPGRFYPLGMAGGRLLTAVFGQTPGVSPVYRLGDEVISNPTPFNSYVTLVDGRLFWRSDDGGLFDAAGFLIQPSVSGAWFADVSAGDGMPRLTFRWQMESSRYYVDARVRDESVTYQLPGDPASVAVAAEGPVFISVEMPPGRVAPRPSLLDLSTGSLHPFAGLDDARFGRALVRGVARGPFWRVAGAPGGCLPVQTAARRQSEAIACLPEGSLVRPLGERRRFRGEDFVTVALPDGRSGWALSAYLQR